MFVTFEGIEGAGKSTLLSAVAAGLRRREVAYRLTREPGGTPLGEALRALFNDPGARIDPLAEVFILAAARAQHVADVIRPALAAGQVVLCDRFYDATIAYQGYGRGLAADMLLTVSQLASGGLEPDATFLLDIPPALSLVRVAERNRGAVALDRLELEQLEFHQRVREGYLELARRFDRIVVLDGQQPVETLAAQAIDRIVGRAA